MLVPDYAIAIAIAIPTQKLLPLVFQGSLSLAYRYRRILILVYRMMAGSIQGLLPEESSPDIYLQY